MFACVPVILDVIPPPARTVAASKRKLSLDLGGGGGGATASDQEGAKRAKTDAAQSLDGMFRQFVKSESEVG